MRRIHRARSGRWHFADCLSLSHDGPCECPPDVQSEAASAQIDEYLLDDYDVATSLLALRERLDNPRVSV